MILKVTCPSCGKAYRLSPPYPPAGKRYRCSCQSIITVSYPPGLQRMISEGDASPDTDAPAAVSVEPEEAASPPSLTDAPGPGEAPPLASTGEVIDRLLWTETFEYPPDLLKTARQEAPAAPAPRPLEGPNLAELTDTQLGQTHLAATQEGRSGVSQTAAVEDLRRTDKMAAAPRPSEAFKATREAGADFYETLPLPTPTAPEASQEIEPAFLKETRGPVAPPAQAPGPVARAPKPKLPIVTPPKADATPAAAKPPRAKAPLFSFAKAEEAPKDAPAQGHGQGDDGAAPPPGAPPRDGRSPWIWLLAAVLLLGVLGVGTVGGVVWYYSQDLPSVDALSDYKPPEVSRIYSVDGEIIGEYFEEYREVVPFEEIPKNLSNAFLAAEDANFFSHGGIDYLGVMRAFFINVQEGRMAQGASTITQQVARSFLLTREKKIDRKIREVLLAYRVEANFSKEHILYLYLNQIFLGEGAYGVKAAARIFFDKDIQDLTLAESAILAGLPQAPSAYNPVRNWSDARRRQEYVLGQMVKNEFITEAEANAALAQELVLVGRVNKNQGPAASFAEHVRRYLVEAYGHDEVYKGGLRVETTVDMTLQRAASLAIKEGCERTDKRVGYRGPVETLAEGDIGPWLGAQREALRLADWAAIPGGEAKNGPAPSAPPALTKGQTLPGVIKDVQERYARIGLDSGRDAYLLLEDHTWLYVPNPKRNWKHRAQDDLKAILHVGDVLNLEVTALPGAAAPKAAPSALTESQGFGSLARVAIVQVPEVEGALFSYRLKDGAVLAMVGGYSFTSSEFNRVTQGLRQSGSTFKPFVYAAALSHPEKDYSPSTILLDAPLTMHKETSTEESVELWKPSNYAGDYMGEVTVRKALILSRNTPTIRILDDIGVPYFYEFVQKIGFDSPLNRDLSMGLGTSSITLLELARAYSIFPSGGDRIEPRFVDQVIDRDGVVLEDNRGKAERKPAISPEAAFVTANLLKDVVQMGTGTKARELGTVAGKTGTTNDFKDAWFLGFSAEVVTGVWHGFNQPASMGYGQAGGDTALPTWIQYMKPVMKQYPDTHLEPPGDVVFVNVDIDSGLLATPTSGNSRRVAFIKGTEPKQYARGAGEVGTDDFFMMDSPF